jgi:hypothetical protein
MKKNINLFLFVAFIIFAILACNTNNTGNNAGNNTSNNDSDIEIIKGELVFEDDFSDEDSGWLILDETEYSADYVDGGYLVSVYQEEFYFVDAAGSIFSDVILEVDAEFYGGGEDNFYGLVCRYVDIDNFYGFAISTDGYYAILKSFEGEALVIGADDFQESDLIKQGMRENHLRAECVDNRLALYVNGELLIETYDSDIPEGDIGFIVGTVSAETTEILFDNIEIYEP